MLSVHGHAPLRGNGCTYAGPCVYHGWDLGRAGLCLGLCPICWFCVLCSLFSPLFRNLVSGKVGLAAAAFAMRVSSAHPPSDYTGRTRVLVVPKVCECVPFSCQSVLLLSTPFCESLACSNCMAIAGVSLLLERACCCFACFPASRLRCCLVWTSLYTEQSKQLGTRTRALDIGSCVPSCLSGCLDSVIGCYGLSQRVCVFVLLLSVRCTPYTVVGSQLWLPFLRNIALLVLYNTAGAGLRVALNLQPSAHSTGLLLGFCGACVHHHSKLSLRSCLCWKGCSERGASCRIVCSMPAAVCL
jgi:hypothetical protein